MVLLRIGGARDRLEEKRGLLDVRVKYLRQSLPPHKFTFVSVYATNNVSMEFNPEEPTAVEAAEKTEEHPARSEWLKAELEGNLRFPQAPMGLCSFIGQALLNGEKGDEEIMSFARSKLSEEHLERIRSAMTSAHSAKGIPVVAMSHLPQAIKKMGADAFMSDPRASLVTDAKFHALWEDEKRMVITYLGEAINALGNSTIIRIDKRPYIEIARDVSQLLRKKEGDMFQRLQRIFDTAVTILRSEDVGQLAKLYRESFGYRHADLTDDERIQAKERSRELKRTLEKLVRDGLRKEYPEIADSISDVFWAYREP